MHKQQPQTTKQVPPHGASDPHALLWASVHVPPAVPSKDPLPSKQITQTASTSQCTFPSNSFSQKFHYQTLSSNSISQKHTIKMLVIRN